MHLYVDIGDASSSLRGSTSSFNLKTFYVFSVQCLRSLHSSPNIFFMRYISCILRYSSQMCSQRDANYSIQILLFYTITVFLQLYIVLFPMSERIALPKRRDLLLDEFHLLFLEEQFISKLSKSFRTTF